MIRSFIRETVYRQGYDRALLDVKEWFDRHSMSLKMERLYSKQGIDLLLNALIENSERFSVEGDEMELYYNKNEKNMKPAGR
jgi:hypothetical protein